jgi:F0F1-type ATP synthase membrane subunit c/vacuolar-type H+-ATPase subunit K
MTEDERSLRKAVIVFAILEALFLVPLVILLILSR